MIVHIEAGARRSAVAHGFLDRWHRLVSERRVDGISALVADDVELGAPPYWGVIHGREAVAHLLGLLFETIHDFSYRREWCTDRDLALEFFGRVGSLDLQGIDLITLGAGGEIRRIDVLMRPVSAVEALRDIIAPRMDEFFCRLAARP